MEETKTNPQIKHNNNIDNNINKLMKEINK